jgi:hypothetical protein
MVVMLTLGTAAPLPLISMEQPQDRGICTSWDICEDCKYNAAIIAFFTLILSKTRFMSVNCQKSRRCI